MKLTPPLGRGEDGEEETTTPETEEAAPAAEAETTETEAEPTPEEDVKVEDDVDMSEYYDEDDEGVAEYKTEDPNDFHDPDDDKKTIPVAVSSSFQEYLESQVGMLDLDERQQQIAIHLIGSLDDDGYLRRDMGAIEDDLMFRQNINTDEKELNFILEQISKSWILPE